MFVQSSALQTAADVLTAIISIITKLFMPVPVLSLLIPKGFASFLCRCMGRGISPLRLWLALPQAQIPGLLVKPSGCAHSSVVRAGGGSAQGWGLASSCPALSEVAASVPLLVAKWTGCCFPASSFPCVPTGKSFSVLLGALRILLCHCMAQGFVEEGRDHSSLLMT